MNRLYVLFWAFCLGFYSGFSAPIARHFIVIGIDGMSPDGVQKARTPVMDRMMKEGAYTFYARGVLPTSSSQNWASMVMGAGPEQHGITGNGWERDDYPFPPVIVGPEGLFPTIFCQIKKADPMAETGIIYDWDGFGRLCEKSCISYDKDAAGEDSTALLASRYILEKKPRFLFVHLDHVDGAGHGAGHGTPAYYSAVEKADSLIGEIWNAIEKAGMASETVLLITSDHGGKGKGHGGESLEELEIPFILYGKGVKRGQQIIQPVYQYDNAATVAFVLDVPVPYAWTGRAVKSAFEGFEDPAGSVPVKRIARPKISPDAGGDDIPGGLFQGAIPMCTLKTDLQTDKIFYTTDGSDPGKGSNLYTRPFSVTKTCVLKARAFSEDGSFSEVSKAMFRIIPAGTTPKVHYRYFEMNPKGEDQEIPDLRSLPVVREGNTLEFRLDGIPTRDGQFALELTASLDIRQSGSYKFFTFSDDGSRLFIDEQSVVNNDGNHGTKEKGGSISLDAGIHKLKVTYYNGFGGKWLDVLWMGDGLFPKQILSPEFFR
jgi:hypothetical protein